MMSPVSGGSKAGGVGSHHVLEVNAVGRRHALDWRPTHGRGEVRRGRHREWLCQNTWRRSRGGRRLAQLFELADHQLQKICGEVESINCSGEIINYEICSKIIFIKINNVGNKK